MLDASVRQYQKMYLRRLADTPFYVHPKTVIMIQVLRCECRLSKCSFVSLLTTEKGSAVGPILLHTMAKVKSEVSLTFVDEYSLATNQITSKNLNAEPPPLPPLPPCLILNAGS